MLVMYGTLMCWKSFYRGSSLDKLRCVIFFAGFFWSLISPGMFFSGVVFCGKLTEPDLAHRGTGIGFYEGAGG
jgi:hypothetical protein